MTNEELVYAVQQGNQGAIEELWIQVERFIAAKADDYLRSCPEKHKNLKDDMIQQSYFTLLDAVKNYKAEPGATFLTYFSKCLKKPFREVLFSGRGSRLENDPLNNAVSLEKPLYENDDGSVVTLADTLAEPCKELEEVEADDYWTSVNAYMKECFRKYGTEMGAAILSYMVDNDCSFRDAVLALYGDDISTNRKVRSKYEYHKHKTEVDVQRNWNRSTEKEMRRKLMLDFISLERYGLRDTGLKHFQERGISCVEAAVIFRNDK